jgi:hypothetical protein
MVHQHTTKFQNFTYGLFIHYSSIFCCSQISSCYFVSKCIRDRNHSRLMIQWSCAILPTPHLLTHSHKAAVWFPYQLLEGSLSLVGFTRGRSAASVRCSVQTRTPCHPDASRLHRAVIVRVPKGDLQQHDCNFRNISATRVYYCTEYKTSD